MTGDADLEALVLSCLATPDPRAELEHRTKGQPELLAAALPVLLQVQRLEGEALPALTIPDVEVQGILGRGGQATVYRGRQLYLQRPVAVKVLAQPADPAFVRRFRREAQTLATLQHPHIVACHQAGVTDDGQCWLVMELVEGPSLRAWLNDHGTLDPTTALRLTREIAQALATAQQAGIVHRDVKPENVLLKPRAEAAPDDPFPFVAKLADLGMARPHDNLGEGSLLTTAGMLIGTPATMAPEQIDDPGKVDHRADIYGLGCVLFHALAGRAAFPGKVVTQILAQKAKQPAPTLNGLVPGLPVPIAALVASMLARDPADRPRSYAELMARLDTLESPALPRRRRWLVPAGVLAVLGVSFAAFALLRPTPIKAHLLHPASLREGDTATLTLQLLAPPATAPAFVWRQTTGPAIELSQVGGSELAITAPHGAAGAELGFEVRVTANATTTPFPASLRVAADPAAAALTLGELRPLLHRDGDDPLAGWRVTDATDWQRDDFQAGDTVGARVHRKRDCSTASYVLPRGSWDLTGSLEPGFLYQSAEQPQVRCRIAGLRLEFPGGHGLALEVSPVADQPASYHVELLRLQRHVAGWQRVAVLGQQQVTLGPQQGLTFTCMARDDALQWSWAGAAPMRIQPAEWGMTWAPGQLAIYVTDGNACFRDLALRGR